MGIGGMIHLKLQQTSNKESCRIPQQCHEIRILQISHSHKFPIAGLINQQESARCKLRQCGCASTPVRHAKFSNQGRKSSFFLRRSHIPVIIIITKNDVTYLVQFLLFLLSTTGSDESVESILLSSVHRHVVGGARWRRLLSECQGERVLVRVLLLTANVVSKVHI